MREIKITRYQCETCGEKYKTEKEALACEDKPITQDIGIQVGDVVKITGGEGIGCLAKVTNKSICSKHWGHYAWKRYWHTPAICADLINGAGSRLLTWDQCEKQEAQNAD